MAIWKVIFKKISIFNELRYKYIYFYKNTHNNNENNGGDNNGGNNNNVDNNNNDYIVLKIIFIIIGIIILLVLGICIGKYIIQHSKKRKNVIDEDYDYTIKKENDEIN